MLGQSFDPNQFLGPFGATLLAIGGLWILGRATITLLNKLLASKDEELIDARKDRDQWKELALKGLSAAEKSTAIAETVVSDDVVVELRKLQKEVSKLRDDDQ